MTIVNPYEIKEPAVISFSGGATSAFMLRQIIDAHGGKLPNYIKVAFANTGLEHEETLKFVEKTSIEWEVEIAWLEYDGYKKWKQTNYATASRNGEPFDTLIKERNYLPNPITRFCTVELKIRTLDRWAESINDFVDGHIECIGLRYDEPHRVHRIKANSRRNEAYCPMFNAKHTLEDVERFWANQPFRLEIPRLLGNCVGCFLKGASKISLIAKQYPELLEWWAQREEQPLPNAKNRYFRKDRPSYRGLINMARSQNEIDFPDDETLPCNCTD